MKHLFLTLALAASSLLSASAGTLPAVDSLLARILPNNGDAQRVTYDLQAGDGETFTVSRDGNSIHVVGSTPLAITTGINWGLHRVGVDITWNAPTGTLPATLPAFDTETHTAAVDYRYYFNFCTHSYTMSFWGWDRWQQEIDWMALHGVNLPLIITGMECVWKRVLQDGYGYKGLDGVNKFVTGGAYYGWFFMNNMTEWGGPQPESWFTQREALAKRIFHRLADFGITPLIPGYVGMVPSDFLTYAAADSVKDWRASDIVNGGNWNQFARPYFVNNTARLKEFAAKYYKAIDDVYGTDLKTNYYAIDPFHEGGVPGGVTSAKNSIQAMWDALQAYDSNAIWVAQHWQNNPTNDLTHTVPVGRLLILNLHGDSNGETSLGGANSDASGKKHMWVWGQTSNFGGNVGIFGRLTRLLTTFYTAYNSKSSNNLVGIGAVPEGIENNPMLYELLYSLPWTTPRDQRYTQATWLRDYIQMRYGVTQQSDPEAYATLLSVWTRLANGIYNCQANGQQGTTESVFLMRPARKPGSVSTWAYSSWYWDIEDLRTAAFEMTTVAAKLKDNPCYRYDLVDIMRQALADYGKQTLDTIGTMQRGAQRTALQDRFLDLILSQDTLLGTLKDFRLGTWIQRARDLGTNDEERALYERNARMLITTWGAQAQCNGGGLHDYGNREWNGLLSSYYYPRWHRFFTNNMASSDWFNFYEWPFATGDETKANMKHLPDGAPYAYGTFSAEPVGDPVETAVRMYNKYFAAYRPAAWAPADVDTSLTYTITNATAWHDAAGTEGLCLAAPNGDYSAGYRLQRTTLNANDSAFLWRFVRVAPFTYKLLNVKAAAEGLYGAYLSSVPSSEAYKAFTLNATGSTYTLYQNGDDYYLQDAVTGDYMAPDTQWPTACVLVSQTRGAAATVRLTPVASSGIASLRANGKAGNASVQRYSLTGSRVGDDYRGVVIEKGSGTVTKTIRRK